MRLRAVFVWVILPLALAAATAGCGGPGDGLPRHEVTGKVTFEGQPLANGTIQFQPSAVQGTPVSAGGVIKGGEFRISRDDGLVPGTYKVMIFSHGGNAQAASSDPGPQTGPPPELIPSQYNSATTLTAEVTSDKPNNFTFDLKK
jgi:hypothetical protein